MNSLSGITMTKEIKIRKSMPPELGAKIRPIYRKYYDPVRWFRFNHYKKYYPEYNDIIDDLRDIHKGERCFVWGAGPSLKKTDLDLLKDEINFGNNSLARGDFAQSFKYFCVYDWLAWHDNSKYIIPLDAKVFLGDNAAKLYLSRKRHYDRQMKSKPVVIKKKGHFDDFPDGATIKINDLKDGAYSGCSIVGFCMQIAFHMGFKEVYLIGCDCDYSKDLHWHTARKTGRFFGIQDTDLPGLLRSFPKMKKTFEDDSRQVYNATVGGKLDIFERKKLEDVI